MGKIKGLSIALAMVAAIAVAASPASAASYKSESSTTHKKWTTSSATYFLGATVKCTHKSGTSHISSTSVTTITMTSVSYLGCTVAGQAATINMNGCTFKMGEPTGASSPYTVKTITIECPAGKEIVITATTSGCTLKIGAQTTTGTSTATNNAGPPKTITFGANISGIKYTSSGGICGSSGEKGTYTASMLVQGFKDAADTEPTGIFVG